MQPEQIGFIGAGQMATALAQGFVKAGLTPGAAVHASDPSALWKVIVTAFTSLHATGRYDNPLASPWYSWLVLYHPIVVKLSSYGTTSRYASSAGNPVFWFPASLLAIGLPLTRGLATLQPRLRRYWASYFDAPFTKAVLVLATGWAALFMLFAVSMGKHSFFYHYQPSYGFAIVLLAGVTAKLEQRRPSPDYQQGQEEP